MNDKDLFRLPPDLRLRAPNRRYIGLWVGAATVVVAALALFCEMHLTAAPIEQTVMTAAVMILCCFIMYTSLFDAGHQRACTSESYREKAQTYTRVREEACEGSGTGELEAFCTRLIEEELRQARERVLGAAGEDLDTFERWQSGALTGKAFSALARRKRRAMHRAARLKPLRLSATALLSAAPSRHRQGLMSVQARRVRKTLTAQIPTVLGSLITVAVTFEGIGMTPAATVAALLRLFTVVWTGVRGYSAGSYAVCEDDCAALDGKTTLLRTYCAERQKNGTA